MPKVDPKTMASTHPKVFFGGDSAFGPKNIIWAVAHGHEAAISIDRLCRGEDINVRPSPQVGVSSQKMGIHEWSYDNEITNDKRFGCRIPKRLTLKDIRRKSNSGFDLQLALEEAQRCLNCDATDRVHRPHCIECDACVDICPMDCITFTETARKPNCASGCRRPRRIQPGSLYRQ